MAYVTDQLVTQLIMSMHQIPQQELYLLAMTLNVEQQQITEAIEWLQEVGVDITIHANQILLAAPLYLLNEGKLKQALPCHIFYFHTLDSTNQFMLKNQQHLSSGDLCLAEYQTQGRGRQGKIWTTAYGSSVCFSLIHRLPIGFEYMSGLSLVVGLAIVDGLTGLGVKDVALKWPNDIYRQTKKLAGILIESNYDDTHDATTLVIGVGMNLFYSQAMPDCPIADLADKVDTQDFKNKLVITLWHTIQAALGLYEAQGFASFQQRWNQFDLYYQKQVYIYDGVTTYCGRHHGINEKGYLLLGLENGQCMQFNHAVSLRLASE